MTLPGAYECVCELRLLIYLVSTKLIDPMPSRKWSWGPLSRKTKRAVVNE